MPMNVQHEPLDDSGLVVIPESTRSAFEKRGYSTEVLPVPAAERTWGVRDYISVWMGPIHNILSYFTVVGFFAFGLSAVQVVAAIFTAAAIVSIGYILNGHAAARYGVPFAMQLRNTFGVRGALLPTILRGLIAGCVFFGVATIASARALDIVLAQIIPGYLEIGGGASVLGLAVPTLISYIIMWIVTVGLFLGGMAFIDRFSKWASPAVYVLIVIGVVIAVGNVGSVGDVFSYDPVDTPVTPLVFIMCVSMLVSNWAGPIVNISDLTRNARHVKAPMIGFPIGLLVSYALFALTTVAFMASLETLGDVDPNNPTIFVDAINSIGNPVIVVLLLLAMNIGQTAFVVFGNMLPSGLQMTAQLPRYFNVKTGGLLAAVIGTAILPWKFVENTDALFFFYSFIGSMFGPIAGIMMASYWFERRRQLSLEDIYVAPGELGSYPGGVNKMALMILGISFLVTMSGKLFTDIPFLVTINDLAFFSGLTIGFFGYIAGCHVWSPRSDRVLDLH